MQLGEERQGEPEEDERERDGPVDDAAESRGGGHLPREVGGGRPDQPVVGRGRQPEEGDGGDAERGGEREAEREEVHRAEREHEEEGHPRDDEERPRVYLRSPTTTESDVATGHGWGWDASAKKLSRGRGNGEPMTTSQGDPRVHLVMNLVLSTLFASVVVWGLSFLDIVPFTLRNVAIGALGLALLTFVVLR